MVERRLIHSLCALLWRWFCGSSQWWWNMYIIVVWKILFIVTAEGIWITEYAAYSLNIAFKNKAKHSNTNCRRIFSWVQKARTELNFRLFAWMCCLWRFFSQRDELDDLQMHFCLRLLCFLSLYWRNVDFCETLTPSADELDEAFTELRFLIKAYLGLEPPAVSDSSQDLNSKAGTGTVSRHILLLLSVKHSNLFVTRIKIWDWCNLWDCLSLKALCAAL